ncbi:PKS-NRPS hybrid synthetase CHGG_01239-like [Vigna radiata var. radiata]|uniref:PKS-NRPS hybrid synthetase CHGG_01239-like n=1 Tax=Vigna radiata var. radiata TaxID=3916 RepID=A0A1S3U388_VIGRR|nr:PKS-NRPS hybrid synthetase CHGG_01239-like [Vigna radiata var. radiata]
MAYDLGFIVVIIRSDKATGVRGRKTFVKLGCERGGKYRKYKVDALSSVYGTRKCECPFRLKGRPCSDGDGWVLNVMCGHHNHELAETLVGHPHARRLNMSEKSLLVDMTKSKVTPANILLTLKQNNDRNVTTINQIYNARQAYKRSLRGSRTELQQLMMLLNRDKYIHWSRCIDDSKVITDVFWTHPDAVKLLNSFNVVFMMDSTYKTNKYRLPLLEIVGMTCTGLTFSATFSFLFTKRQSNFTWASEKLKGLFITSEGSPKVIVTDRDLALMNAIANVFPESYQMVEFAHASLKKILSNSMGDLCSCWDSIHNFVTIQHNKIKTSFEKFGCSQVTLLKDTDLIAEELERGQQIGLDSSKYGCVLRRTFGVPCACELARYDPGMIPVGEFHIMWQRLHFSNVELNEIKPHLSIKDVLKQIEERFNEADIRGKVTIKQKLLDITCPTLTSMVPPLDKVKTKGAKKRKVQRTERSTTRDPSYFEYVDAFHSTMESLSVKK